MKDKNLEILLNRNSEYLRLMKSQRIIEKEKSTILTSVAETYTPPTKIKTTVQIGRERKKMDIKYFKYVCIDKLKLNKNASNLVIAKEIRKETKWKLKNTKGSRKAFIMRFGRMLTGVNTGSYAKKYYSRSNSSRTDFYRSREWRELRYQVFMKYDRKCMCCGATPENNNIVIHVDHIKPRSKYPGLELDINNMQVLCEDCNLGKSNISNADFRPVKEPELSEDQLSHMQSIVDGG